MFPMHREDAVCVLAKELINIHRYWPINSSLVLACPTVIFPASEHDRCNWTVS